MLTLRQGKRNVSQYISKGGYYGWLIMQRNFGHLNKLNPLRYNNILAHE